ncbi:MAG: sugar phosphate isomerase/epimerase [Opitutus sp.]|nr:sugar phosphate isomerase/epimerase [Opitutus sp.]
MAFLSGATASPLTESRLLSSFRMSSESTSTPVSRRDFVSRLAVAGAALPFVGAGSAARAAETKPAKPASPAPTVIHVFSKPLHWMSYADTAAMVKAAGYGGIDYTVRAAQGHVLPERVQEDLPRAIDAAHAAGLKVELITTKITSVRDQHAETVLKTAAKLGVKCYRTGNFNYDAKLGVTGTHEKLRPGLKELAALNASLGIHGAIQNHAGTRVGSALWDLHALLRDIDPRGLGVQYDIRHAVVEGGQSWPVALKLLAPWIRCTDMKDFKWEQAPGKATIENVPIGEGVVPFDAYFKLVRELQIAGPMSVHLEYPPFERTQLSEAEKRAKFPALMKKDLLALKGFMAKQHIV